MKEKGFVKGGLVYDCQECYYGISENIIDREKLPWQTIARTCAPDDAVKAVIEHHDRRALILYRDSQGFGLKVHCNFLIPMYAPIMIDYGPASETPEGEISIERIGE